MWTSHMGLSVHVHIYIHIHIHVYIYDVIWNYPDSKVHGANMGPTWGR